MRTIGDVLAAVVGIVVTGIGCLAQLGLALLGLAFVLGLLKACVG